MSATDATLLNVPPTEARLPRRANAFFIPLFFASILAFLVPPTGRIWRKASLGAAAWIAAVNTVAAFAWMVAIGVCFQIWLPEQRRLSVTQPAIPAHWGGAHAALKSLLTVLVNGWNYSSFFDKISMVIGTVGLIATAFLVPFFVLLPFGARPGPNRPCIRHVARTVFLGTGLGYWWGAAFCAAVLLLETQLHSNDEYPGAPARAGSLFWLLSLFCGLAIWHLAVLIHEVRRDYRGPRDLPEPHDPWCDNCGYDLLMAPRDGRCPECGREVSDSLGTATRPPTPWETRPVPWNLPVIRQQLAALARHPRRLFFSMPTLTGQPAAQRWLIGSMLAIAALASLIVPVLYLALNADWNGVAIPASLAMGLVWGIFGMMMVGIETLGIATFSKMRKLPPGGVYLSAAAKVTCYASTLMLAWVLLGGVQLVLLVYFLQPEHSIFKMLSLGIRGQQMLLAGSLSIAHIGGLLWFELTVYRGIRAIQFANR